jgi:hypothetical protein
MDSIAWDTVSHAYGPAVEVPSWIRGLNDPFLASECLNELYGSITHQGTRYSATAPCVPFLVAAAADPGVIDRVGVLFLIQFCAIGYSGDQLDWRHQRDLQSDEWQQSSWRAVVAEHGRLADLLADSDRSVAAAALTVLAWTGADSDRLWAAIASDLGSDDERDVASAWLASTVLGRLPPSVVAPVDLPRQNGTARFGAAIAALRFGGESASRQAVDELSSLFATVESRRELTGCEFLAPEVPERFAAAALAGVPGHLLDYTSAKLLDAVRRGPTLGVEALMAYLRLHLGEPKGDLEMSALNAGQHDALAALADALRGWEHNPTISNRIYELEEYGLPSTAPSLAAALSAPGN